MHILCTHTYLYMLTCDVHIYIHTHIYTYIYYVYMYIHIYIYICVCGCVSAYVCISKYELCKSFEGFFQNLNQEIASSCYTNNATKIIFSLEEVSMFSSYDFYRQ